jgi:hypothetical protein
MWHGRVPRIGCAAVFFLALLLVGGALFSRASWNEGFAAGLLAGGAEGNPVNPAYFHGGGTSWPALGLLAFLAIGFLTLLALFFVGRFMVHGRPWHRGWGHGPWNGAPAGGPAGEQAGKEAAAGPHQSPGHVPPWWCGHAEPPADWVPPWWRHHAPPAPGNVEKTPEPPVEGEQ